MGLQKEHYCRRGRCCACLDFWANWIIEKSPQKPFIFIIKQVENNDKNEEEKKKLFWFLYPGAGTKIHIVFLNIVKFLFEDIVQISVFTRDPWEC